MSAVAERNRWAKAAIRQLQEVREISRASTTVVGAEEISKVTAPWFGLTRERIEMIGIVGGTLAGWIVVYEFMKGRRR